MYRFKQIKAKYSFVSEMITPWGDRSVYYRTEQVDAVPNMQEGLTFILRGAESELINNVPPKEFDFIMSQLGASLYPIEIQVLKNGEIKKIRKFEEIKKRWETSSKHTLSLYKNAYWVERYVNMTTKNFVSEEQFSRSLMRNSFVQLFFIDEGAKSKEFMLYDFPASGDCKAIHFELISIDYDIYTYRTGQSELRITYTDKGLVDELLFVCRVEVADQGYYTKRIKIKLIENKK